MRFRKISVIKLERDTQVLKCHSKHLVKMDTFTGDVNLSYSFCLLSQCGSTLKGNEFLLYISKFFDVTHFGEVSSSRNAKNITKIVFLGT